MRTSVVTPSDLSKNAAIPYSRHVADKPGVLNRVSSLVRRRDYNIESLTVGHAGTPGVSRITLVVDANPEAAARIEANLYKLVHVLRVQNVTDVPAVYRYMALIKVAATAESRSQVMQLVDVFRARVVWSLPEDGRMGLVFSGAASAGIDAVELIRADLGM